MTKKRKYWIIAIGLAIVFTVLVCVAAGNHSKYAREQMRERGKSHIPDYIRR